MTLPTTPTGGEPTAGPEMCLVTLEKKMGEALVEAYLAAPTLAARVAELEGMLAVAKPLLDAAAEYGAERMKWKPAEGLPPSKAALTIAAVFYSFNIAHNPTPNTGETP